MTTPTAWPLVQATARDSGVLGRRLGRRRRARRTNCGRCRLSGSATAHSRRLLLFRGGRCLPVGDKILIAWSTGSRRGTGRFTSGPVWPGVGNSSRNLGAGPNNQAEAERQQRQGVPLEYHATRWIVP
jgi:hypothetical protein